MLKTIFMTKKNVYVALFLSCVVLCVSMFSGMFYVNAETEDWNIVSAGGGWYETDGVLNPTAPNEVAQYRTKIIGNFKLDLEIALAKDSNATTAFQVALFADEDSPDMQYAYNILLDTINDYVVVSNNVEYAGTLIGEKSYSGELRDGIAKTLTIISYNQKLYVSYDGVQIVAGYEMAVTNGYLNISAADIRDGVLSTTFSENYMPSEAELNTSGVVEEKDTYIDFTGTDGSNAVGFSGGYGSWKISGNTFKPDRVFATTLFDKGVRYSEEKSIREITFKFKMDGEFHFGFVKNVTDANQDSALMAHIKTSSISFANATGGTMETYRTVNLTLDAETEHEVKIITRDGKAAFYMDGTYMYSHILPVDANLILFQSNGANGYIDNFSISKEESENQIYLDFETAEEASLVKTIYAGWALDGTSSNIKPGAQWAASYIDHSVDLVQDNKIVIAKMKMNIKATNFVVSLMSGTEVPANKQPVGAGQLVFTTNGVQYRTTTASGDLSGTYITICSQNYIGTTIELTMSVAGSYVDFIINGEQFTSKCTLPNTACYLGWQSGGTSEDRIDSVSMEVKEDTYSNYFTGVYNSWTVFGGTYKPNINYASVRGTHSIIANKRNTVSFDVCTTDVFNFALADSLSTGNTVKGIVVHCNASTIIFNDNIANSLNPFKTVSLNIVDGKHHTIEMQFGDGEVGFFIDGEEIYRHVISFEQYIPVFQLANTASYIQNYKFLKNGAVQILTNSTALAEKEVFLGHNVVGGGYNGMYQEGSVIAKSNDIETEAITVKFYMTYGASARLATEGGLRWETNIDYADYEKLQTINSKLEFGTRITSEGSDKQVNIPVVQSGYQYGDDFRWRGALISIKPQNYERRLLGTGYINIAYANGNTATVYATADDNGRSYYAVIEAAYADVKETADDVYKTAVDVNGATKYTYLNKEEFDALTEIRNLILEYINIAQR